MPVTEPVGGGPTPEVVAPGEDSAAMADGKRSGRAYAAMTIAQLAGHLTGADDRQRWKHIDRPSNCQDDTKSIFKAALTPSGWPR